MGEPKRTFRTIRAEKVQLLSKFRVPSSRTTDAVFEVLSSLDCPKSLAIWLMFKNNEHEQLLDQTADPLHFNNAEDFRNAYLATNLLSKSTFLNVGFDRKKVAFDKFNQFEEQCAVTNLRFRNLANDPLYKGSNVWLLNATIRKISQILGEFSYDEVLQGANWGPGVTLAIKGKNATGVNKFQHEVGITRELYSLVLPTEGFPPWWYDYPLWSEHLINNKMFPFRVGGSVTVTVPKTAKTDRVISIEPGLNLWVQKGIGLAIRKRLKGRGVDLNDQSVNQSLCRRALKLDLATVDFSSASDSISRELVREVMPPDWFEWMDAARSHYGSIQDQPFRWNKFSSMGNGFTFELESLIFYSAALSVAEYLDTPKEDLDNISVFGDDVIIPNSCFDLFSSFSKFLGFTVNMDKSFSSGLFRESCGAHYFDGVDVKPFFIKKVLSTPETVYSYANAVRLFSHRAMNFMACDRRFEHAFKQAMRWVPSKIRFRVSYLLGDSGFLSNFDEARPSLATSRKPFKVGGKEIPHPDCEGYLTEAAVRVAVTQQSQRIGLHLCRLRGLTTQEDHNFPSAKVDGNHFPLRGHTKVKVKLLLVPQWYNLGPWL